MSAAQVVRDPLVGDYSDLDRLREVAAGCEVMTFDHEHVPTEHLRALEADGRAPAGPVPAALVHAQDKAVMRERLTALGAAVPALAGGRRRRRGSTRSPRRVGGCPVVLKATRGGYDGKGVWVVDCAADPRRGGRSPPAAADAGRGAGRTSRRELAVLAARSPSGQTAVYPVVESVQRDGVCREVDRARARARPGPGGGRPSRSRCGSPASSAWSACWRSRCSRPATAGCWSTSWRCARTTPATGPSTARDDQPVREPPARGARPAARRPACPGAVDGDGQHPRRRCAAGSTTAPARARPRPGRAGAPVRQAGPARPQGGPRDGVRRRPRPRCARGPGTRPAWFAGTA